MNQLVLKQERRDIDIHELNKGQRTEMIFTKQWNVGVQFYDKNCGGRLSLAYTNDGFTGSLCLIKHHL